MDANSKAKEASIEATIIRLDGSKEPLGVISYWHRNPLMRAWHWLKQNWGLSR
jgi:hypothetical protein